MPLLEDARRALSPYAELRGRVGWIVLGGLIVQFGLGFGYAYGHILKDIEADLGWTRATVASGRVLLMLAMSAASPVFGFAVVRYGPRPILVGATLLLGVAVALQSQMWLLWHFWLSAVLQGVVGAGVGDVVVGAVVSRWTTRARGIALGIVFAGANVAGTLLSLILPRVAVSLGWRDGLLACGLAGVALILPFAAFVLRDPPARLEPVSPGEGDRPRTLGSDDDLDLRAALRTRSFWVLAFVLAAFFFVFVGVLDHLVTSLRDAGLDRVAAGDLFALITFSAIFAKVGYGALADLMDYRRAMLLQMGVLAVSSALLFTAPTPIVTPIVLVAFGVSTAARDVVYPLIIDYCFGVRYLAEIYGTIMGLLFFGGLGSLFAGALADATGGYTAVWHTYGGVATLAFAACFLLRDERAAQRP